MDLLLKVSKETAEEIQKGVVGVEVNGAIPFLVKDNLPVKVIYFVDEEIIGRFYVEDFIAIPEESGKYKNRARWIIKGSSNVEFDKTFPVETATKFPEQITEGKEWMYIPKYTKNQIAYSFDGENYYFTYDTIAEATEDIKSEIKEILRDRIKGRDVLVPEYVYIGDCEMYQPNLSCTGFDIIESVICAADDEGFGDYTDGYLDVSKEQREELEEEIEKVFQNWIMKHNLEAGFYKVYGYDKVSTLQIIQEAEEELKGESPE